MAWFSANKSVVALQKTACKRKHVCVKYFTVVHSRQERICIFYEGSKQPHLHSLTLFFYFPFLPESEVKDDQREKKTMAPLQLLCKQEHMIRVITLRELKYYCRRGGGSFLVAKQRSDPPHTAGIHVKTKKNTVRECHGRGWGLPCSTRHLPCRWER